MGIMQHPLFICAAALFAVLPSLAATNIIEKVTPDKPLRYEKRNGRLEVRSLITLSKARKIGDETLDAGLETLASDVSGKACDVVLFNTFAQPRTAIATVSSQDASVQILDAAGTAVPCQRSGQEIHFLASVPGFGYARYRVVPSGGGAVPAVPSAECGDNFCSNRYYDVTFGPGGITRLFDRELGRNIVQNEKYAFGDIYEVTYSGNGAGEFVRIRGVDGGFAVLSFPHKS